MKYRNPFRCTSALLALLLLLCCLPLALSACRTTPPEDDGTINVDEDHDRQWLSTEPESVPDVPENGIYALYAVNSSAAGYLQGAKKQKLGEGVTSEAVTAKARQGYCFVAWSDGVTEPTRSGDSFDSTTVITAIFDYHCFELPAILLTTETGKEVESKTEYIDGTFAIINADEEEHNILTPLENEIRGRGNNTWTYEKKSYKIKFPEKQDPLNLGKKETTFVLLANVCDQSLLRNDTALELMDMFEHLRYSPNAMSVEVYLNGEYRGVYLFAEEITEDKAHLDLDDSQVDSEVDTGYLLEMSYYAETVDFSVAGKNFEIKSDLAKDDDLAAQQRSYIGDYVMSAWKALKKGDRAEIEKWIDPDTLVDAYIAEEIVKNLDMGWDSFYLHKDAGGRLCFGPLWDFDLSFGNGDETCQYYTELYCARNYLQHLSNPWFYTAMQYDWFRTMVTERWDEMYDRLLTLSDGVREKGQAYAESFDRNFVKWDILGKCMNRETELIMSRTSHKEHYTYLAEWIDNRIAWLDGFYHSEEYRAGEWRYEEQFIDQRYDAEDLADALRKDAVDVTPLIKQSSIHTTIPGMNEREGVRQLLDGDPSTKYCLEHTHTVHVTFMTTEAVPLVGFSVTTGNDTHAFPERNPQTFALYGSTDGEDWVLLSLVGYGHNVLGPESEVEYAFAINDPTAYRYFRFGFNNNETMQLSELTLYAAK